MTLSKGQYQIGSLVFGKQTNILVESFDVKPYDVNAQDYQVSRSDEIRFGYDSFKPTTIEINMTVIYNWLLDPFKSRNPTFWLDKPTVNDLAKEWRANGIRNSWGEMKPLYYCGRDGLPKVIYGRPGQFTSEKISENSTLVKCVAEFRRADTLVYSTSETGLSLTNSPQTIMRTRGDAPSWIRIVGIGPLTSPTITVGSYTISINRTFTAGEVFEINAYPWSRRIIDGNGNNLRTAMIGSSSYLDTFKIEPGTATLVSWNAGNVNQWVPDLGNASWSVESEDLDQHQLPSTFLVTAGRPVIKRDLLNPAGPTKYISGRALAHTDAALYTAKSYNTTTQMLQANIVGPYRGRSGLIIMSNLAMSNYALLEISSGSGDNKLTIRVGNAWDDVSAAKAAWTNPSAWTETDVIKFGYNPSNKTFTGYLNGAAVVTWVDSGNLVTANATTNKYSGFIFDLDGTLLSQNGTGFSNITAWDNVTVPASTGSVNLYWRDAWSSIV